MTITRTEAWALVTVVIEARCALVERLHENERRGLPNHTTNGYWDARLVFALAIADRIADELRATAVDA